MIITYQQCGKLPFADEFSELSEEAECNVRGTLNFNRRWHLLHFAEICLEPNVFPDVCLFVALELQRVQKFFNQIVACPFPNQSLRSVGFACMVTRKENEGDALFLGPRHFSVPMP